MSAILGVAWQPVCQGAAGAMFASLWQGALLTFAISICLKLVPRTSASLRFLVWSVVFLSVAMLPVLYLAPAAHPQIAKASPVSAGPVLSLDFRWAVGIAFIWLVFSLFKLSSLAKSARKVRNLKRNSALLQPDTSLQSLLAQAGFFRSARLYSSAEVDQPCVIGFLSPRILLPDWLVSKATPAEMRQVVLHEVSHLSRLDDWTNLLQKLALVLFPLNPALAWIEKKLCTEREKACDESVVRATHAPHEYATCLTNLAEDRMERRHARHASVLSLGAWETRSELGARIKSILNCGKQPRPAIARTWMAALILTTVGAAARLGSSPQLIAFTPLSDVQAQQASFAAQDLPQAGSLQASKAQYHAVVYREPVATSRMLVRRSSAVRGASDSLQSAQRVKLRKQTPSRAAARAAAPTLLHTSSTPVDEFIPSFIIVTRWNTPAGQQTTVTVVDSIFRISASAAQSQSGWFIVQL